MPARLLRVLRESGLDLSSTELLDALWLATRFPQGPASRRAVTADGGDRTAVPSPVPDGRSPTDTAETTGPPGPPPDDGPDRAALHASATEPAAATEGPASGAERASIAVRVPERKALAAELPLARSLRPLKQRRTGNRGRTAAGPLDEEATAAAWADTGVPDVVLRPSPERWLDLALVIDDGVSMLLWQRLCVELRALLQRVGAFRNVRVHGLRTRGPGGPRLSWRPFSGDVARLAPACVADPSGRTLVLVVSDGVGTMWRDGRMRAVLEHWARCGPTAVVHALPRRMWPGSGIAAEPWQVVVRQPAAANHTWQVSDPVLPPELASFDGVPVPVLEPEPAALAAWARLTASRGASAVLPLLAWAETQDPPPVADPTPAGGLADPVLRFRDAASPQAYRLAAHLAAVAPLSVPVMRLVQTAVPWRAETAHLAEVFLGGLMRRGAPPTNTAGADPLHPQLQRFDFDDQVRAVLLDAVPAGELLASTETITEELTALVGRSPDFPAWLAHPGGPDLLPDDGRPFAWVQARLLAHLGMREPAGSAADGDGGDDAPPDESAMGLLATTQQLDAALSSWQSVLVRQAIGPFRVLLKNDSSPRTVTYVAEQPKGQRVLVRVPRTGGLAAEGALRRGLQREAQALGWMRSRYAPTLVSVDLGDRPPWLATDLLATRSGAPAPTLRALHAVPGWRWTPRGFATFGWQLASTLGRCHLGRMVHGTLSPDTVLVAEDRIQLVGWSRVTLAAGGAPDDSWVRSRQAADVRVLVDVLGMSAEAGGLQELPGPVREVLDDSAEHPTARRVAHAFRLVLNDLPVETPTGAAFPAPHRRIAVIDFSDGADLGVTTALLGMLLSEQHGGGVLVVDGALTPNALDHRVRYTHEGPVRAERLDLGPARASLSRHRSGLRVLSYAPRTTNPLADPDFAALIPTIAESHPLLLLDPGGGLQLRHNDAVPASANRALVVVRGDDGRRLDHATLALKWLSEAGHQDLADRAVIAVKEPPTRLDRLRTWPAETRLRQRGHQVLHLPNDRSLGDGELGTDRLAPEALAAYRALAEVLGTL
ncbi:hypothetical protein AQ490_01270 [Wenjunlia vitaminophila]|uniref:Serine/threonine protein kinase n=1 Tax=Wenjunlia vitaminophila TaxID=76728 RepID=A0A0T6LZL5_WENVI|nr:SAV_2336 N-terminal domain-related protein [Wenjunlia vitaminophila]KRV51417.1 hypothetical protein AQ490_01270 [Wenjunlia vitaminophila]